jgi:hypothetical protein
LIRRVAIALLIASAFGCSVSRPGDLAERLWTCQDGSDCMSGWACADRNVLGEDFCRPACDREAPTSCDGVCTKTGECLAECTLLGDQTTPCPVDHTCVRTDLLGDEGICFPTDSCSRSDECPDGSRCFNDVFQLPAIVPGIEYASDHLYCVAIPDETNRCPTGYVFVPSTDLDEPFCLPRCDTDTARCPPNLTCLRDYGFILGQPGVDLCYPGYWALPCDDDAQCMVGRCLEVGEGRRACTYLCEDADRAFGTPGLGCDLLEASSRSLWLDALDVRCENVANQNVCVPFGVNGAPCNDDTICAPGLECREFTSGPNRVRFCSRDCTNDRDCDQEGSPRTAYCQRGNNISSCVPRTFEGGFCTRHEQCRSGLICRNSTCESGPDV